MENLISQPAGTTKEDYEHIQKCSAYAIKCHADTNHTYDGKPYSVHLSLVFYYAFKYSYLVKHLSLRNIFSGAYTHDTIEDTRQTYNNVKDVCGEEIAEITYALSNEKGRSRKERANDKYYAGIRAIPEAHFIKICDRLANIKYSKDSKSGMLNKYRKEEQDFEQQLYKDEFEPMFLELNQLLNY